MDSYEIIQKIVNAEKQTPCKIYLEGKLGHCNLSKLDFFGNDNFGTLFCELDEWQLLYAENKQHISKFRIEMDRRNSAILLADYSKYNARIEPGVTIRDMVDIGDNCVIMMGATINIGAEIGRKTMIDMNVVIGGRAIIGNNCHIGAGSVLAGVIEPPSAKPVIIEDDVVIGANAVILEGIRVGKGAVVAAGAVVVNDVEDATIVAGVPAKMIKKVDSKTRLKTELIDELRKL